MSQSAPAPYDIRFGIDLGGTKIEIVALDHDGAYAHRHRIPTPTDYAACIEALAGLVLEAEQALGRKGSVGIGIPGVISPTTGLVKNGNNIPLNGQHFDLDISARLNREVRVGNDARCFALSEASDGAAVGYRTVFGVILGTGVGCGIVVDGQLIIGPNRVAGEWGHVPLPWPTAEEVPGRKCWCGQHGCMETWVAGPALARLYAGEDAKDAHDIPARAAAGDAQAQQALAIHTDRLGRGFASIVNTLDPDVIVLGGGLSNMDHLYAEVPKAMRRHVFGDFVQTRIVKNKHGDSSGVRGAAWLWPPPPRG